VLCLSAAQEFPVSWPAPWSHRMAKPGSYEDLQDRILGAGASSTGGLPPGTDRAAFHADARLLSRKLQQMNAGLIDPYGKFMNYWDGVILLAMVYTTSVTPLEIAFIRNPSVNLLFAFNQVVNLIFVLDLVLNFFMPYKEPLLKGGQTVRSHALIARHYLRGWFFVDFVSIIPFDIMDAAVRPPSRHLRPRLPLPLAIASPISPSPALGTPRQQPPPLSVPTPHDRARPRRARCRAGGL
jgi:hypothetical protein